MARRQDGQAQVSGGRGGSRLAASGVPTAARLRQQQPASVVTCARARRTDAATSGQDGLVTVPNIKRRPEFMLCTDFKVFEMSKR